jgi:hypothetical protein
MGGFGEVLLMFVFIDFLRIKEWLLVDHTVLNVKNKFLGMIIYQFFLIYLFKENAGNVKKNFNTISTC